MELCIYDTDLNYIGIVDDIRSMVWTRKFQDVGTMELETPFTTRYREMLVRGNFITNGKGGDVRIINAVSFKKDNDGIDTIQVSGEDPLMLMSRRIISEDDYGTVTQDRGLLVANYINRNTTGAKRGIPYIKCVLGYRDYIGEEISFSFNAGTSVLDIIRNLLNATKLGIRTELDFDTRYIVYHIVRSENKGASSITPVVLSYDWGTLGEHDYSESDLNYVNVIYNWWEWDDESSSTPPSNWHGEPVMFITHDEITGADRREGLGKTYTTATLGDAQAAALADYHIEATELNVFNGSLNENSGYEYKKDYDLGDIVFMTNKEWDVAAEKVITSITETYDNGFLSVSTQFGEDTVNLLKKSLDKIIRRALL